jgi:hypothetical protein
MNGEKANTENSSKENLTNLEPETPTENETHEL